MTEAIESMVTAVKAQNKTRIVELTEEFQDSSTRQRQSEKPLLELARKVRVLSTPDSPEFTTASEYNEIYSDLESSRGQANAALLNILNNGTGFTQAENTLQDLLTNLEAIQDVGQELEQTRDSLDVPVILALTGSRDYEVPKGGEVSIILSLKNVGNTSAKEIAVTVEGDMNLTTDPTPVRDLGKDESRDVTLTGSTSNAGQFNITAVASTADTTESHDVTVIVVDKADYLERARQQTQNLQDTLDGFDLAQQTAADGGQGGEGGGQKGGGNDPAAGLGNKLETVEERLTQLIQQVDKGRPNSQAVDNEIGSVINTYEAFINQVEGLDGNQLTEFQAGLLGADGRRTVETLEKAQEAEV